MKPLLVLSLLALAFSGCAGEASEDERGDDAASSEDAISQVPSPYLPSFLEGLAWFKWLETNYPQWYFASKRSEVDARPWGGGFDPVTDPIFSHNELEIEGVAPREVLALMENGRSDMAHAYRAGAATASARRQCAR